MPARVVTITNRKGGVGKSTLAVLLVQYLASQGHRVLAVDLDVQGDFSRPLIASGKCVVSETTSERVLTDPEATVEDAPFVLMREDELALSELERHPELYNDFAKNMRRFMRRHAEAFDFIVIDTNPVQDIRVLAAMVSSDYVLSPITLTKEALEGIRALFNDPRTGVFVVQENYNRKLQFLGMLPVMVDERNAVDRECLAALLGAPDYRKHLLSFVDEPTSGRDFLKIKHRTIWRAFHESGAVLWEQKSGPAREVWAEVEPVMQRIAQLMGAK
ncbi:ParA family protein [Azohydromonas aeria]|uniref:ParA family protein n=1 Tax=Azohydromonas aeria TaxID=2590212 RepID=UPI0012F84DC5|nr:ParA family protein [Azohydromonas aeria]